MRCWGSHRIGCYRRSGHRDGIVVEPDTNAPCAMFTWAMDNESIPYSKCPRQGGSGHLDVGRRSCCSSIERLPTPPGSATLRAPIPRSFELTATRAMNARRSGIHGRTYLNRPKLLIRFEQARKTRERQRRTRKDERIQSGSIRRAKHALLVTGEGRPLAVSLAGSSGGRCHHLRSVVPASDPCARWRRGTLSPGRGLPLTDRLVGKPT